jgi:protein-L-isoaspartate(D-aspartate) O-methyltransferase
MVEQQIRPWDVLDQKILDLLNEIPRDEFVPENYRNLAYADMEIPLGRGREMMAPKIEGRMLQALDIQPTDTVLEVGTGSGFCTAMMARLARHVYSVEISPDLKMEAERHLRSHNIDNVTLEDGDAHAGWDKHAPYDVIAITGSLPELPDSFRQSLAINGRLFAVIGKAPVMKAYLITRLGKDDFADEVLFETELRPLDNIPEKHIFEL